MAYVLILPIRLLVRLLVAALERVLLHLTGPSRHSITLSTAADLTRRKAELIAEHTLVL